MHSIESVFILFSAFIYVHGRTDWREHKNWPKEFEDNCGENYADRIIGGKNATIGQFPWMARLHIRSYLVLFPAQTERVSYDCSGSLITDRHVISAAHCVYSDSKRANVLEGVLLGDWDSDNDPDCEDGFCAETAQYIRPENIYMLNTYNTPRIAHDIVVIRLAKPAILNDFVIPICLPAGDEIASSNIAEVAGWGLVDSKLKEVSRFLQYVKIPIEPMNVCNEHFDSMIINEDRQICAGGEKSKDSCSGDSGGPLMQVMEGPNGPRYYLTGIVSFGKSICGSSIPAIYTRVTHYLPFILKMLK